MELELTVLFEREGDWWLARIPEIPGAHSQGRTREEALEMVVDAARELGLARREAALAESKSAESEEYKASVSVRLAA